jgi:hypothetical protein
MHIFIPQEVLRGGMGLDLSLADAKGIVHIDTFIFMNVIYIYIYVYNYIYLHVCIFIHKRIFIHMYIFIHI